MPTQSIDTIEWDGVQKKLATVTGINLKTAAATNLYTVPAGKTLIVTEIVT